MSLHYICRKSTFYPVCRALVPPEFVPWNVPCPSYNPPCFSEPYLASAAWADPDIHDANFKPRWNVKDDSINRESYNMDGITHYEIVENYPLNPKGRTGLKGRGRLGRWGPNHAADAVVTRWKRDEDNYQIFDKDSMPILQVLMIKRSDSHQWAVPGGFMEKNETPAAAVVRELLEEAVDSSNFTASYRDALSVFFKNGKMIYRGYVDDPRNTDNAWIETFAANFHDHIGKLMNQLVLNARDDAIDVKWMDISDGMQIYESHNPIIENTYDFHMKTLCSYLHQIYPLRFHSARRLNLPYSY